MPVSSSPDGPAGADETLAVVCENAQDTRAPLGKDGGAAEATFAGAVGGGAGWQGGAEDAPGLVIPREREERRDGVPAGEGAGMGRFELDDEQVDLVEQALRHADADLEGLE